MKKLSKLCAAPAILLASCSLTSCAHVSSAPRESRSLYQPPVLRLEAGQAIATRDGTHLPQTDELWHSDARFRALETQLVNTAAALAQERARAR